ncbi:MAG: NAD(P)-dependent oxidoreductase [Anaerolineae bacterium]|nr:NAD(P)-dependent oxidoreductase [Anaerolineae bacterium]
MAIKENLGILHPGQMGISVAASAQNSGHPVYWVSEGRSTQTRERAESFELKDAGTLAALCEICPIIVSVCPPHAAEDVARAVLAQGFTGLYVDVNAVAPQRVRRIGQAMDEAGATFVDGGIIGGPAWTPGQTWLYLSGPQAYQAAACFERGPLETQIIGDEIGSASALKMCFAAYTKGSTALLCAILATAERLGVREMLEYQWSRGGSDFASQTRERTQRVTAKAWRFAGEMDEIAATFESAGLPGGFHRAAGEVYRRIAGFKDAPDMPPLDEVLAALLRQDSQE